MSTPNLTLFAPADSKQPKKKPSKYNRQRQRATAKSDGCCVYCGHKLHTGITLDHVVPKSRGGSRSIENIVLCCTRCNLAKGDQTPEEWALSILQYRSRIADGRPSRLVEFIQKHRSTLPRLAVRANAMINAILVVILAGKGGAR